MVELKSIQSLFQFQQNSPLWNAINLLANMHTCTLCDMQHSWEECGLAEEEVAGLRESLMALHCQLQQSPPTHKTRLSFAATPSKARAGFPLATSVSFTVTPSKARPLFATPSKANLPPVIETSQLESPHSEVELNFVEIFIELLNILYDRERCRPGETVTTRNRRSSRSWKERWRKNWHHFMITWRWLWSELCLHVDCILYCTEWETTETGGTRKVGRGEEIHAGAVGRGRRENQDFEWRKRKSGITVSC